MARPKKDITMDARLEIRMTTAEKAILNERAQKEGMGISEYVRKIIFPSQVASLTSAR